MIEVRHLTKKYGKNTVVNDLSFTIENGKIYGFLGPNGAGKSTTMNMLTGCLAATEGEIKINGHDIYDEPVEAKKIIGYLPEQPPLYQDMTPFEYLTFVSEAKSIPSDERADAVIDVMDKTGITEMRNRLICNLSKGYKQRVGIAQAMLGDPELIILDEPTVGLDPKQITEIRELISELGKDKTVILSSHILAEISAVCDHVMIMSHGRLVASDTLGNIKKSYSEDNSVTLNVKGKRGEIESVINSVAGVISYDADTVPGDGEIMRVVVRSNDADINEKLFFAFSEAKLPILKMTDTALSLEEIFLKLTDDGDYSEADEADTDSESRMAEEDSADDTVDGSDDGDSDVDSADGDDDTDDEDEKEAEL